MSGHTEGPWRVSLHRCSNGDLLRVRPIGSNTPVCGVHRSGGRFDEARANARLIAAAPDLLAACKLALARGRVDDSEAAMNQLAAAIALAEGPQS